MNYNQYRLFGYYKKFYQNNEKWRDDINVFG